jgi:hypothetical protein
VNLADGQLKSLESGELLTGPTADAANTFRKDACVRQFAVLDGAVLNGL